MTQIALEQFEKNIVDYAIDSTGDLIGEKFIDYVDRNINQLSSDDKVQFFKDKGNAELLDTIFKAKFAQLEEYNKVASMVLGLFFINKEELSDPKAFAGASKLIQGALLESDVTPQEAEQSKVEVQQTIKVAFNAASAQQDETSKFLKGITTKLKPLEGKQYSALSDMILDTYIATDTKGPLQKKFSFKNPFKR